MRFKIGDTVRLKDNKTEIYIVAKTKHSTSKVDDISAIIGKSNLIDVENQIDAINLGAFDYAIVKAHAAPHPVSNIDAAIKLVSEADIIQML